MENNVEEEVKLVGSKEMNEQEFIGTMKKSIWSADHLLHKIHTPGTMINVNHLLLALECTLKNILLHIVNKDNESYTVLSDELVKIKSEIDSLIKWAIDIQEKLPEDKKNINNLH